MEEKDVKIIEDRFAAVGEEIILDLADRIKESEKKIYKRLDKLEKRQISANKSLDDLENYIKQLVDVLKEVIQ